MDSHVDNREFQLMLDVNLARMQHFWHTARRLNIFQYIVEIALILVSPVVVMLAKNLLSRYNIVRSLHVGLRLLQPLLPPTRQISWSITGSLFPGLFHSLPTRLCSRGTDTTFKLWRIVHSSSGRFHRAIDKQHKRYGS